jgi:hypothetical protein
MPKIGAKLFEFLGDWESTTPGWPDDPPQGRPPLPALPNQKRYRHLIVRKTARSIVPVRDARALIR